MHRWIHASRRQGLQQLIGWHGTLSMQTALQAARIMRGDPRNKVPCEYVAADLLLNGHATQQADALLTSDAGFFRKSNSYQA